MATKKGDNSKLLEEKLREHCSTGDESKVKVLLEKGVDINAANKMNGWTPLHWAAKRGHKNLVQLLLSKGAVTTLKTKKGETPASLAGKQEIKDIIGVQEDEPKESTSIEALPIVPNYIKNPPFIYLNGKDDDDEVDMTDSSDSLPLGLGKKIQDTDRNNFQSPSRPIRETFTSPPKKTIAIDLDNNNDDIPALHLSYPELVLKVRIANSREGDDFIEVELDYCNLTFDNLLDVCCKELELDRSRVRKVRKLPNTLIRKDKDVGRLKQFQELEIICTAD